MAVRIDQIETLAKVRCRLHVHPSNQNTKLTLNLNSHESGHKKERESKAWMQTSKTSVHSS
jgi:hypothetical protein